MSTFTWLFVGIIAGFAIGKIWGDLADSLKRFKSWRIKRGRN